MCPLSEETQPVRPVPVSLANAGLVKAEPAPIGTPEKKHLGLPPASSQAGDTQPVSTRPVRVAPVLPQDSSVSELGRLIFGYRPQPGNKVTRWALGLSGAGVSAGAWGYGAYLAINTYERFGPVPALARSTSWLVLGGVALLVLLAAGILHRARLQPGVRLHTNGLLIEGRRKQSLTWEQIDGIAQGVTASERMNPSEILYRACLFPRQGRPIQLYGTGDGKRGISDLPELVSRIKASLYPNLQVELVRMFREGLPVHFGPVSMDRQGLKLRRLGPIPGTHSVPWGYVKRITVKSGYFLVESSSRRSPYRLPVSKIPNLEILLKMIDQGVQP